MAGLCPLTGCCTGAAAESHAGSDMAMAIAGSGSRNEKRAFRARRLEELFDVRELQEMQDAFAAVADIGLSIVHPDGSPLTKASGVSGLCAAIRGTEEGYAACREMLLRLAASGSLAPTVGRCSCSGLLCASIPIVVTGVHLGSCIIGSVMAEDADGAGCGAYPGQCGIGSDEYWRELARIKRVSGRKFEEICSFVRMFVENLSRFGMRKLELQEEIGRRRLQESVIQRLNDKMACDINEKKLIEQALKHSEERFRYIFEEAPMGIGVFDLLTRKTKQVNGKYAEVVGRTREEMLRTDWADITHPDDLEKDMTDTLLLMNNPGRGIKRYKRYLKPDGSIVWAELTVVALRSADGKSFNEITMMEDITERRAREERILYLNYHDVLTGLYNRAYIDEETARLEENGVAPVSVIIGDINGLKLINDAFGHQDGDRLLSEIAAILSGFCREEDIAARIGGDEFLILLPGVDEDGVRAICLDIIHECEKIAASDEKDIFIPSIALGYATKYDGKASFAKTIRSAEDFMYRRKLLDRKSMHSSLIESIKATMFEKSHETEAHAERLVRLSGMLGRELGLGNNEMNELALLATLHDIGKVSVDDYILKKPGRLSEDEWAEIRKHPEAGYRIALASPELNEIAEFILCHHEHWDGNGYPQGLKGEEIPLLSRIIAVVDAFDAITEDRSYRKALPRQTAIDEIERNAGKQFDPVLARLFIDRVLPANGFGDHDAGPMV